jgi:hypothetical protein
MFGMHFLAYPDDPIRCVQREAQATLIKNVWEKEGEGGKEREGEGRRGKEREGEVRRGKEKEGGE